MNITYKLEWLKEIVEAICEITNVSISVLDSKYNPLYYCEKGNDSYCHLLQKTKLGQELCHHSDTELYKKCAEKKQPVSHICHAGVIDTAFPILKNGLVAGFIMIGRIRNKKTFSCTNALLDQNIDVDTFQKHYKKLTYLSDSQLLAVITLLSHLLLEKVIEADYDQFINRATDYIENNLSADLSIALICEVFHVSKNTLYKEFSKFYGCTVNQYIATRRIEKAKCLLSNTNDSMVQIAQKIGFDNYTYFPKFFKRYTGQSPRDYRTQHHKG